MARCPELARLFEHPTLPVQRHYEICRAYFCEDTSAPELAARFGMHRGSVQVIVRDFAAAGDPSRFFCQRRRGPKTAPKRDAVRERASQLRRAGSSLGEIHRQLVSEGLEISESHLFRLLRDEGLMGDGRRQYRRPTPPGQRARDGSEVPPVADARHVSLIPGHITTHAAGLFLFVGQLLDLDFRAAVKRAGFPGTKQIPALQAMLALLAPKLLGRWRTSHISDLSTDQGAGLFAGLNVLPKTTYATDYSYKTQRSMHERLVGELIRKRPPGESPESFNFDFHPIPFRGEDSELEQHWVPLRNRALPSVMSLVVQERQGRAICYGTANVLREEAWKMVGTFADYWKEQTGHYPASLLFDSRATTYEGLAELERRQVGFITVRRRGAGMVRRVQGLPKSAWKQCQITQAKGGRRRVRYLDERVRIDGYEGEVRQLVIDGLGRELPTFLLTNDRPEALTAPQTLQTYASRNHVEGALGDLIKFFHLDCLASDVRLNADFDLTLTLVANLLYRDLAARLKGFQHASPQRLYRKFVATHGTIEVTEREVIVRFAKRAHNPIMKEARLDQPTPPVPWLDRRTVRLEFP